MFFLISAGHESRRDWNLLQTISPEVHRFRVLLWEKVLQILSQTETTHELVQIIPNLADYITPEDRYMGGVEA